MLGWIGSLIFACCAAPQAYKSYREKHSNGISTLSLILWTLGEIVTLTAVLMDNKRAFLIFNYVSNLTFLAVVWYYKLRR